MLRGYNLENASTWLKLGKQKNHKPTDLHYRFIAESHAKVGQIGSEVFISYSRADSDFSRKLNEQLQLSGKTTWFDQESIASSADFEDEIFKGIMVSDNFLFIISPDSVASPYCEAEVEFAEKNNKRIVTILLKATDTETIPKALSTVQWIDFEKRSFSSAYSELLRTVDIDRNYVKKHTKYAQLAQDWSNQNRATAYLLKGLAYTLAQEWLMTACGIDEEDHESFDIKKVDINQIKKNPPPTQLQLTFVSESKKNIDKENQIEKKQQEKLLFLERDQQLKEKRFISAVIVGIIMVGIAIWGLWQNYLSRVETTKVPEQKESTLKVLLEFVPNSTSNVYDFATHKALSYRLMDNYAEAIKFISLAKFAEDRPDSIDIQLLDTAISKLELCIDLLPKTIESYENLELNKTTDLCNDMLELNPESRFATFIKEWSKPFDKQAMCFVEGGTFTIGNKHGRFNERHTYDVTIDDFYISKYEVSNAQYARFLNEYFKHRTKDKDILDSLILLKGRYMGEKCRVYFKDSRFRVQNGYETHPVIYVSWYGANRFCEFYNLKLASEAQWEYAARGGNLSEDFEFSGSNNIEKVGWFGVTIHDSISESLAAAYRPGTKPIGMKYCNELGIHDLSGNAMEWCRDFYRGKYNIKDTLNPSGPKNGIEAVLRGGSWHNPSNYCRNTDRRAYNKIARYAFVGFRYVAEK